jgi:GT2 family glycosyltransferase
LTGPGRQDRSGAPRCSILIPVHERVALTRACLDALTPQVGADAEVVVVDDGSPEPAERVLAPHSESVRIVRRERQGGFGAACNLGAAAAAGSLLVLLNNDCLPAEGWLAALVRYADAHPEAAIVGAKILWPDNTVQHAGVVIDENGNGRHLYEGFHAGHPAVNRSRRFQAVTAAAMLIRRDAFESLGGFDTAFVNGWEDVDLCLRAGQRGYEVHYCHESVVYHLEGATRGRKFEGDAANFRRWRERWAGRLRRDDVSYYAEDGLLRLDHADGRVKVGVAPDLGVVDGDPQPDAFERLLADRTRKCLELLRDNVRLSLSREAAVDPWRAACRRAQGAGEPTVSVVISVSHHGHFDEILAALGDQTVDPERYEVLVVGAEPVASTGAPTARQAVARAPATAGARYVDGGETGGRARAWNCGIREARGRIVLLLADDLLPGPDFVEEHIAAHEADPSPELVALGPALFSAEARAASPFARWLEDSGELFGVSFTRPVDGLPGRFFYGANTSVKRSFLLEGGLFDERFEREAWDDHELGLRLFERGMRVVYVPAAALRHEHDLTLAERCEVMRHAGRAAATFDRLYPPPHPWTSGTDEGTPTLELELRAQVARARHRLFRRDEDLAAYFHCTVRRAFLEGYRDVAWRETSAIP